VTLGVRARLSDFGFVPVGAFSEATEVRILWPNVSLPLCDGVYAFLSKAGTVEGLYIGKSDRSLRDRIRGYCSDKSRNQRGHFHAELRRLIKEEGPLEIWVLERIGERTLKTPLQLEKEFIRVLDPGLNKLSKFGRVPVFRPVRDADAQDLIGLITLCFAEHPGCFFDPHGDMPDIVRPAQSRLATEGQFLVVEDATGRACACIGVDFPDAATAELHRLYVRPDHRGRGLAKLLTARMEAFARERGAARMILWSDTRFKAAHAMYGKLGYARGVTRSLGDISQSREIFFERTL
jgi:putative acetyltransferase